MMPRFHHRRRKQPPVPSPLRRGLGRGCAPGTRGASQRARKSGFTLIEVILALVILGAALSMLSDVIQLASRHAVEARAETQAQSLAESIMDQVIAGAVEMTSVSRQQLEVDDATPWVYTINAGTTELTGISAVEVIVEQDIEIQFSPVKFRLMRWVPTVAELPESGGPVGGASGAGSSSGSNSSSGGAAGGGASGGGAAGGSMGGGSP